MNTTLNDDAQKEVAKLSKVTPSKKERAWTQYPFIAGGLVGIVLLGFAFLPQKTKAEKIIEQSPAEPTSTLSQNLELLESLKKQTLTSQVGPSKPIRPPKLRETKAHKISKETLARMNAPTTFFNESISANPLTTDSTKRALLVGNNQDSQFINQQNDMVSVSAKRLAHPQMTVPAGEMIPATLETAIHSELPGMVRAIITRDVYSLVGEHCLIPKGSTLVGQFNASVVQGQSRILVVWNRVQLPNGVIVTLNSPSTDSIGRAGQGADYINRHFLERFSTSALLSILGAVSANSGVNGQDQYNSQAQYRMSIASSFQQSASQTLQADMNIKPTLQINQGALIHVFVAQDLDFHAVGASS